MEMVTLKWLIGVVALKMVSGCTVVLCCQGLVVLCCQGLVVLRCQGLVIAQ